MSGKPNITILTASDFPYGGAAENLVRQLALGIHENGVKVEVVRYRGSRYASQNDTDIPCSNYVFKKPRKGDIFNMLEQVVIYILTPFLLAYRKFKKHDEHIVLYGLEFSPIIRPIRFWTKLFGIKCYRFITDYYDDKVIASVWWKNIKHVFYRKQFQEIDPRLDGLFVVSYFLYEFCLQNGIAKEKIVLVPHFIDTELKENAHDTPQKFTITYSGTLRRENGIYDLLEAYKLVFQQDSTVKLKLMGEVDEELRTLLATAPYKDLTIETTGFLQKHDIMKNMLNSSVLVNPRIAGRRADAGFPTKMGEYLSTKIPVVSTKVGDLPRYLEDKVNIIFAEANDPRSLAESLLYVKNHEKESKIIANQGYTWANEQLHYIKNSKKVIEFIKHDGK
jgi:glycosyltransferase involved in cell wall biosynthesis